MLFLKFVIPIYHSLDNWNILYLFSYKLFFMSIIFNLLNFAGLFYIRYNSEKSYINYLIVGKTVKLSYYIIL